jgi:hypothetical protein
MNFLKIKLLIIAIVMFAASTAFASLSSTVYVDTSSLSGGSGYLYFNFIPGGDSLSATATVSKWALNNGTLGAQDTVNVVNGSAVTGSLPGTVTFANTNGSNDYSHAITFGNNFSFQVVLDGDAVNTPNNGTFASTFSLSLYQDALGATPLKTSDGILFSLNVNGDGTKTYTTFDSGTSVTPIPAAAWLFGSGLMGLVGIRRRKK